MLLTGMFQSKSVLFGFPQISNREYEKRLCGSGSNSADGGQCHFSYNGTTLHFYWAQSVYSRSVHSIISTPADLVILNVGSHYLFTHLDGAIEKISVEAKELLSAIETSPNRRFIFRTITRLCGDNEDSTSLNESFIKANKILVSVLAASPKITIFDAWTDESVCTIYEDNVHSSLLASAQFTELASLLCTNDYFDN